MLTLPIKKRTLVHYVLRKSSFSFFNILGLFFYISFALVLIKEGYNTTGVLGWLLSMVLIFQSANFLNFIINKNNIALGVLTAVLASLISLQKFGFVDVIGYGGQIFDIIYTNPIYSLVVLALVIVLYQLNYKQLHNQVYLDAAVSVKVEKVSTSDMAWIDRLGDVAPFIKNDIRLIWRNKRTKTVFLMSFLFLFYGLFFFTQETY